MSKTEIDERAKPLADADLTARLMQFIKTASDQRQVKRGANEVTKALNRLAYFTLFCFYLN